MAYNFQPAEVADFTGGMTDDYVNAAPKYAQEMMNVVLLDNKSMRTRFGTRLEDTTEPQIPIGFVRISGLHSYFDEDLLVFSAKKIYYRDPVTYASLLGPTSNNPMESSAAYTDHCYSNWNRHVFATSSAWDKPIKIYKDNTDTLQVRTAGLPSIAAPSIAGGVGSNSYIYGFCYKYTYLVGTQEFQDYGPITKVQIENAGVSVSITSLPVLANAIGDNYDTTNIKKVIFRTTSGGVDLFEVAEVSNATTSYVDSTTDTVLVDNTPAYTAGGVPNNDPPPLSKFIHTVNNVTYYGHLKVGTEVLPSQIRQSQAADPDSVPETFYDELEDEITGIGSVADLPIVGCRKHIYRIEGAFDELGRGGMAHRRISDTVGCLSHLSMVGAEGSMFWAGRDGFYMTDGYRVSKVSDHLNSKYAQFVATLGESTQRIKGHYIESKRWVVWTFSNDDQAVGLEECNMIWVLDLRWGLSVNTCLYYWENDQWKLSGFTQHNNKIYHADTNGYVYLFDDQELTDPKVDVAIPVTSWSQKTIIWNYLSSATNFGTDFVRKVANKILLSCKNETNISLAITAVNDDGKITRPIKAVRWRKNFTWGDDEFVWGDPDFVWYYGGMIQMDRRFPAKSYRFSYLQIQLTNDFTNVINSDLAGEAIVNGTLNTATLVDSVTGDWPIQSVDYYMYFEWDNYTKGYKVLTRGPDTLVLEDINNELQAGTWKWQMKGYKKGEITNLLGYSISWAQATRSYDMFNKGEEGGLE